MTDTSYQSRDSAVLGQISIYLRQLVLHDRLAKVFEAQEKGGDCLPLLKSFARHCDYIHYNPVKHGLCQAPKQWRFSSFHRFVAEGVYPENWGVDEMPDTPDEAGFE